MTDYNLIKLNDVETIDPKTIADYYKSYINPGIATFLRLLGFDKYKIVKAEGMYIYTECGRKILDFSGGMSVLNLGHNHPRILAARKKFNENQQIEICKVFISQYQSVLAKNLAAIFPEDLEYTFFCNSGAEANEGALKMALFYHRNTKKDKILFSDIGYHGKTFATMSVSGSVSKPYSELFKNLDGCIQFPYGDIDALHAMIEERSDSEGNNDIAALIIEAVKGDMVIKPPEGYLRGLSALCKKYNIVLIVDEVFTGFGRTGKMFAFEHEGIVPDIVTISKSLGGGKASIAAYIARKEIFDKTYKPLKNSTIHSTTYGGMNEECATAIEAINVIVDENLVENSRVQGVYLLSRMNELKSKHPKYIKDVRGIGCLAVFELHKSSQLLSANLLKKFSQFDEKLEGLLPAIIWSELLKKHNILIYEGSRIDNLFINPSLIVTKVEIDRFIDALDKVFSTSLAKLTLHFASNIM